MRLIPKSIQQGFQSLTIPVVDGLIRAGIGPNLITTVGTLVVVASAVAYGFGSVRLGGALLLASGIVDTLDGAVARKTGQVTRFGAFYDSTLDRVGDGATFMGIAVWLLTTPDEVAWRNWAIAVCITAIVASMLVSYARARAEGLGLDCKVGIAQRAERIVGLGVLSVVVGAGPQALVLEGAVFLLTVASIITVVQRFVYVYQVTEGT
ncbi:MAG TPA: CDP-alcohol phosphatidyltransferase family protein [Gemmatimonadales bacterium]|nr:CDP-alcohol phosphatidyltransferase family protein [Gemmatimonadales bacterium]